MVSKRYPVVGIVCGRDFYFDGYFQSILANVSVQLGFDRNHYQRIVQMVQAQQHFHQDSRGQARYQQQPRADALKEAYAVLGIESTASDAEVKKAYRRQMNQHHPDKLVAKGLPEAMIKMANEKTQEIKAAYEQIKEDVIEKVINPVCGKPQIIP